MLEPLKEPGIEGSKSASEPPAGREETFPIGIVGWLMVLYAIGLTLLIIEDLVSHTILQ